MSIDIEQLRRLNEDYTNCTGKAVQRFVCPITLEDNPDEELCDGHILNDAIKKTSRATVIESKRVDNYFGTTIEPDFVTWLNLHTLSP